MVVGGGNQAGHKELKAFLAGILREGEVEPKHFSTQSMNDGFIKTLNERFSAFATADNPGAMQTLQTLMNRVMGQYADDVPNHEQGIGQNHRAATHGLAGAGAGGVSGVESNPLLAANGVHLEDIIQDINADISYDKENNEFMVSFKLKQENTPSLKLKVSMKPGAPRPQPRFTAEAPPKNRM